MARYMAVLLSVAVALSFAVTCFAKSLFLVKEGMRGDDVRQVQEMLVEKGFLEAGSADGVCGAKTVEAIKKFQEQSGLEPDGICGDETYALLKGNHTLKGAASGETATEALKAGMTGERVKAMQELLAKHGYLLTTPDGIYGGKTEEAVRRFQQDTGLEADGVCGAQTMARLQNKPLPGDGGESAKEESPYAAPGAVIKPGMHGDGVILLQEYLIDLGYLRDSADGLCGPKTVEALKQFQRDNGLEPDGICGSATYGALQVSPGTVAADNPSQPVTDPASMGRAVHVEATAYSPMDPGLSLHTATGKFLRRGIIAVDPDFIPLGTRVYIPGYGEATADDIGGAISGNRIDIAFDTHEEALSFGRQSIDIYILD